MAFPSECDVIAVGAGPANLSLAALAAPVTELRIQVLEQSPAINWHLGLLLTTSTLQVSPYKDLVTLVDPTSQYTFLNFLCKNRRLYRALVAHRASVSRHEFGQYYAWVASQLNSVRLGIKVIHAQHDGKSFVLNTSAGEIRARDLVVGVGRTPFIPEFLRPLIGADVFHSSTFLLAERQFADLDILVVGGGQSGAEIVNHILNLPKLPASLTWVSGRNGFDPLDDSPFSNEYFTPSYTRYFQSLSAHTRAHLLRSQLLSSDGINEDTLLRIYERLYFLDYMSGGTFNHRLLSGFRLTALRRDGQGLVAQLESPQSEQFLTTRVHQVVLATGYTSEIPEFLAELASRFEVDGSNYLVAANYSVKWDGPPHNQIFVQNAARHSHGVADPNLSLVAWRSAVILNELCGREIYPLEADATLTFPGPAITIGDEGRRKLRLKCSVM
jgi:lysine N6-hydroxylase